MHERLIANLCEMVRISSESGDEEEFLTYLSDKLTREVNADCRRDDYGNLICTIGAKHSTALEPILFAAHGDTVKPGVGIQPVVRDGVISSQGETILGADCKAGIAEFLEAVLSAERHPPLQLVVTREEETGFFGVKNLDYSLLRARRGFLLDMDSIDTIVLGGPSHVDIDIQITGKAAHSGMEPEKGISAIAAAAAAIAQLQLGRIDLETTANLGTIHGGSARNCVPAKTVIEGEVRSLDHEKCMRLSETFRETFCEAAQAMGATADVRLVLVYRAYSVEPESPLIRIAVGALREAGIEPKLTAITGGLESAVYQEHGIEIVPIGNGVRAEHTPDEYVLVEDMRRVVRVIHHLFDRLSGARMDESLTSEEGIP
jgi:tripeptide aminopeptidase